MSDERAEYEAFVSACPEYLTTTGLDRARAADYPRLDAEGHAYLDYTGGSLYADSQLTEHIKVLQHSVLGNPHSGSLSSAASTRLVESARQYVLKFFNAAGDYTVVFTPNATGALRHVGECYPFDTGSRFLLPFDNHNSVNGIREFAIRRGASVDYVPLEMPEMRINQEALDVLLSRDERSRSSLFAYPAQSNFSGVKHPLDLVDAAQARGWDVLLDAAAFVPTNRLDLGQVKPDFVAVSFYKMFGYPTGVGALVVRKSALPKLKRPWFAGGTVNFATVQGTIHILSAGEAGFEDGTLNYLSIPAVETGLRHLERLGVQTIQTRVRCLTGWLIDKLLGLQHRNGRHLVRIYGPASTSMRGGTLTMNFYDPDGHLIDYRRVEELANERRISLRTGCFCNPGAGETAEALTAKDIFTAVEANADMTLPRFLQFIQHSEGKSAGAIRVSLGLVTNFSDVHRFLEFAAEFCNQTRLAIGEVTFDIESCRVMRDGS
jgi:selenocysteine lyase/cysteine desulfurase